MDELRWFLLIVGLVVIVAVFLYGRVQDWRHDGPPWSRRRRDGEAPFAEEELSDSDLRDSLDELDSLISEHQTEIRPPQGAAPMPRAAAGDSKAGHGQRRRDREPLFDPDDDAAGLRPAEDELPEPAIGDEPVLPEEAPVRPVAEGRRPAAPKRRDTVAGEPGQDVAAEGLLRALAKPRLDGVSGRLRQVFAGGRDGEATAEREPAEPAPVGEEKIIVINLMAPEGMHFAGPALVDALQRAGMRHGEHDIFHRTLQTRNGTIALYSAANAVKPGTFDLDTIEQFDTPGVSFFLQLPGPFDGLAAFEQMLQAARSVVAELDGHLLDGRRCDLTQQSIEHLREELLEYGRRAHLAARQAR
jgi:cell division protein ZipA